MTTLFLKYRPQTFRDLVGQQKIIQTLQNAIKADRAAHAYIFSGSRGTGKTSSARIFAKALLAPNKEGGVDTSNPLAKAIEEGSMIDVIEVDAASNRGIGEIRDLREKVNFAPNIANKKVYIIDEVHMLTKEAFNALLKTIEEPPPHAYFVLATTELHKIPETIISRCQVFLFKRFTQKEIIDRLQHICTNEQIMADEASLGMIARKAEGGLRDAIGYLEQLASEHKNTLTEATTRTSLGITGHETLGAFWAAIETQNVENGLKILQTINENGTDFRSFGHEFLLFLREKMKQGGGTLSLVLRTIQMVQTAIRDIKTSPIAILPFEVALVHICNGPAMATAQARPQAKETSPAPAPVQSKPIAQTPKAASTKPVRTKPYTVTKASEDAGFVFEGDAPPAAKETQTKSPLIVSKKPEARIAQSDASSNRSTSFTTEKIQSMMNEIATKAELPSYAKRSFLTTKPTVHGGTVVFGATSDFHKEKLQKSEVKLKLQRAIQDLTGDTVTIEIQKIALSQSDVATIDDFSDFSSF